MNIPETRPSDWNLPNSIVYDNDEIFVKTVKTHQNCAAGAAEKSLFGRVPRVPIPYRPPPGGGGVSSRSYDFKHFERVSYDFKMQKSHVSVAVVKFWEFDYGARRIFSGPDSSVRAAQDAQGMGYDRLKPLWHSDKHLGCWIPPGFRTCNLHISDFWFPQHRSISSIEIRREVICYPSFHFLMVWFVAKMCPISPGEEIMISHNTSIWISYSQNQSVTARIHFIKPRKT